MRRRAAAKVQTNFIDIAPSPPFRRIVAFDDGMAGLAKMLGGVTVWRAVAAADMAARPAEAQMHPRRTKFQTFLASERARRYVTDASRAHILRALSSRDLSSRRGGASAPGQISMKRRHHLRALSDGRGDALDRTRAYVADGEYARAIRFQWLCHISGFYLLLLSTRRVPG